jgi:hypothetical protein
MFYYRITFDCDYAGCEDVRYYKSEKEIDYDADWLWEAAREAMEGYEYLSTTDIDKEEYEYEDEYDYACDCAIEDFYDSVNYAVEKLTEEERKEVEDWYEDEDIWEEV